MQQHQSHPYPRRTPLKSLPPFAAMTQNYASSFAFPWSLIKLATRSDRYALIGSTVLRPHWVRWQCGVGRAGTMTWGWILAEEVAWVDYGEKKLSQLPRRWEVHVYIGNVITPRSDHADQQSSFRPMVLRLAPSDPVPASTAPVLFEVLLAEQYFPLRGLVPSWLCLVILSTPNIPLPFACSIIVSFPIPISLSLPFACSIIFSFPIPVPVSLPLAHSFSLQS